MSISIATSSLSPRINSSQTIFFEVNKREDTHLIYKPHYQSNMGLPMPTTTEKPSVSETKEATTTGPANDQSQPQQQQQPKSEVELAAEREYLERMEDEYAKREGGA
jgi:hypothetical protein